ncbi:MAG: DNA repair protein RecN [Gammaproteobacteria bacterium]|nr:DNA repair protein RecN [Gammaproteobacteria bacterium]MDH5592950.1 DNA repair protein RecN [Gammaproteobacteria bacterium]MDH5613952.1 DNA repair protein RecN [Gammaproteobacteria bacterium]
MLTNLHIRDFAIIKESEIEFDSGMTVLTGETGAGKSILIDALSLLLGARADSKSIRHGCQRTEISASFNIETFPEAQHWLVEQELDSDECLLRRVITADGRSKGYINGSPVPAQSLKALGSLLVDIHGQHEHQSLMQRSKQRQLLDDYANHFELLEQLSQAYNKWHSLNDRFDQLKQASADRDSRLDLLRYQVQELELLSPVANEFDELEQQNKKISHASGLLEGCNQIIDEIYENENSTAFSLLSNAAATLDDLSSYDKKLEAITELLNTASIQTQEAANELRDYIDGIELDPEQQKSLEQRLDLYHEQARKHRIMPDALPELLGSLQHELNSLENADTELDNLQDEIKIAADNYKKLALKLTKSRKRNARQLSDLVTEDMQKLGMQGGKFEIELIDNDKNLFSASGLEKVEFMVSANPGQPLQPLTKVASGGELSRISLAIQVSSIKKGQNKPTLIFDEVDVGIGGGVAEVVGQQLRQLGQTSQVMCVTHLPQVAALGHHHFRVNKTTEKDSTHTQLELLDTKNRTQEIARMLGGVKITKQTLAHAEEMLMMASDKKTKPAPV